MEYHSKLVESTQRAVQDYYTFVFDTISKIEAQKDMWNNEYYLEQLKIQNEIIMEKYTETKTAVEDSYKEFTQMIETKKDNALSYPDDYKLLELENLTDREVNTLYQRNRDNYLFVGALNKYCKDHDIRFIGTPTTDLLPDLLDTYQRNFKHFVTPFTASQIAQVKELQQRLDIYSNRGVFYEIDNQIAELL